MIIHIKAQVMLAMFLHSSLVYKPPDGQMRCTKHVQSGCMMETGEAADTHMYSSENSAQLLTHPKREWAEGFAVRVE